MDFIPPELVKPTIASVIVSITLAVAADIYLASREPASSTATYSHQFKQHLERNRSKLGWLAITAVLFIITVLPLAFDQNRTSAMVLLAMLLVAALRLDVVRPHVASGLRLLAARFDASSATAGSLPQALTFIQDRSNMTSATTAVAKSAVAISKDGAKQLAMSEMAALWRIGHLSPELIREWCEFCTANYDDAMPKINPALADLGWMATDWESDD